MPRPNRINLKPHRRTHHPFQNRHRTGLGLHGVAGVHHEVMHAGGMFGIGLVAISHRAVIQGFQMEPAQGECQCRELFGGEPVQLRARDPGPIQVFQSMFQFSQLFLDAFPLQVVVECLLDFLQLQPVTGLRVVLINGLSEGLLGRLTVHQVVNLVAGHIHGHETRIVLGTPFHPSQQQQVMDGKAIFILRGLGVIGGDGGQPGLAGVRLDLGQFPHTPQHRTKTPQRCSARTDGNLVRGATFGDAIGVRQEHPMITRLQTIQHFRIIEERPAQQGLKGGQSFAVVLHVKQDVLMVGNRAFRFGHIGMAGVQQDVVVLIRHQPRSEVARYNQRFILQQRCRILFISRAIQDQPRQTRFKIAACQLLLLGPRLVAHHVAIRIHHRVQELFPALDFRSPSRNGFRVEKRQLNLATKRIPLEANPDAGHLPRKLPLQRSESGKEGERLLRPQLVEDEPAFRHSKSP